MFLNFYVFFYINIINMFDLFFIIYFVNFYKFSIAINFPFLEIRNENTLPN